MDLEKKVRVVQTCCRVHHDVRLFPERHRTTILFATPEVEMYMIGEIFKEHFYQMADITFKFPSWLEKFSILL